MERNKVNKVGASGKLSCTKVNQVNVITMETNGEKQGK
jgi:hypothetical protein